MTPTRTFQALNDATAGVQAGGASDTPAKKSYVPDIPLMLYFFFWYVGNYYVSIIAK